MRKYTLFFIAIFMAFNAAFAAEKTIKVENVNTEYINSEGLFTYKLNIGAQLDMPEVKVQNPVFESISSLPAKTTAQSKFDYKVVSAKERKELVALVEMSAYINEGGQLKKLVAFEVVYDDAAAIPITLNKTFVNNSVLANGSWYKIAIDKRGVYKIDHAFLQSLGLNPANVNPANIRIYGNGGKAFYENVTDGEPDDLVENAIQVVSSGSSFGVNDYVLFYADGPIRWSQKYGDLFEHTANYYENQSYYFLNVDLGAGERVQTNPTTGSAGTVINTFDEYKLFENDSFNIGNAGKIWFSNQMNNANTSTNINMDLGSVAGPVKFEITTAAKIDVGTGSTVIKANGANIYTAVYNPSTGTTVFDYKEATGSINGNPSSINFNFTFSNQSNGKAFVDYIRLNYLRNLSLLSNGTVFRSLQQKNASAGSWVTYSIANANPNAQVWNVTNSLQPQKIAAHLSGSTLQFNAAGGTMEEYVVFDPSQLPTPTVIGSIPNQNLHGLDQVDYLIITNNDILPAANELADLHRTKYGTSVHVVTVDKIYNEFSSGGQDIGGIRNFIRMFYDRGTPGNMVKNVLLFGAASFDYKNRISDNTNIVPVWQSYKSHSYSQAFSTDDYYSFMDDGEHIDSVYTKLADINIGRLPSRNLQEAQYAVKKIKKYVSPESFGEWKNNVSFVTDDFEPGFWFLPSSEQMSAALQNADPAVNQVKLYADATPRVATSSGIKFPTLTRDINNQVLNGTFLLNYIGHGSPDRWAVEEILFRGDIEQWNNLDKLPIVVTATCDYGRFDDPHHYSSGSYLLNKENGGAIAAVTTTQEVMESPNNIVNAAYLQSQFTKDAQGRYLTMGEAYRAAKNAGFSNSGAHDNTLKLTLLGDPALKPSLPENLVQTDSILVLTNDNEYVSTDTMSALGKYRVMGKITDPAGSIKNDFNGQVSVTIFDKMKTMTGTNPALLASSQQKTYTLQNNVLFKGSTNVSNGEFTIDVIIPKDINYDFGKAKISYYAHSNSEDASSSDTNFVMGGFSQFADADDEGPVVKPYIDDNSFENGGIVSSNPMLYVELSDNNGINVSGSSVGHDLIAVLDGDYANPYILNSYYTTEPNDYTKGKVYFQLTRIPPGRHTVTVRAWDVYNNSGEGTVEFNVVGSDTLLFSTYNYPNPFSDETHIVYQHNQPNTDMDVTFRVFNTAGREVYSQSEKHRPEVSHSKIIWRGTDNSGAALPNGLYMYQIHLNTIKGKSKSGYHKVVIGR